MKIERLISLCIALLVSVPAFSTSSRVFVSGSGVDTGSCTIGAPCRNFAYAILQVNTGGEMIALDTAGYGPVTINKALSVIAAPGGTIRVANSMIFGNLNGIMNNGDGRTLTRISGFLVTNTVAGNTTDGTFYDAYGAR